MAVPRSSTLLPLPFFPPFLPFSLSPFLPFSLSPFVLFLFLFFTWGGGGLGIFVGYCIHYMIDSGKQVTHEMLAYFTNTFFIFYFTFNS